MDTLPYYLVRLREEYLRRKRKNPFYSMRAFARFLQIDSSTLAAILKRKRPLPIKKAEVIADRLGVLEIERNLFLKSVLTSRINRSRSASIARDKLHPEPNSQLSAEWENHAVCIFLNLAKNADACEIAERLGLSYSRTQQVLKTLTSAGVIVESSGRFSANDRKHDFDANGKKLHKEVLGLADRHLDEAGLDDLRLFMYSALPVDLQSLPKAKSMLRKMRRRLHQVLSIQKPTEVYQLSIQFFPLTRTKDQATPSQPIE